MITEDKVIEIFYMADEYSREFSKVRQKGRNTPSMRDGMTANVAGTSPTA